METIFMGGLRRRQRLYAMLWGQGRISPWREVAMLPLWCAALGYRCLVQSHVASYTWGWQRRHTLPCRVVSVGNLTVGGTGKTPLTMWLARWYQRQGQRVAVLSRGYGAQPPATLRVVSTGTGPLVAWQAAGDEPYLMAQTLPGVPIIIGRDRVRTGRYAYEQFGSDILLLDDGFQYHALHRDLDLVLVDASNPFGPGALLPRGILREPRTALQRADAVLLSRVEMAGERLPHLTQEIRRWARQTPMYSMTTTAEALCGWGSDAPETSLEWLAQRRLVAFAGIGNPQAFAATLQQLGGEIASLLVFPDHHPYTAHDWRAIMEVAQRQHVEGILTTAKDAVRLHPSWQASVPVYTLRVGLTVTPDITAFCTQLQLW